MRTQASLWMVFLSALIVTNALADDESVETRMRKLEQRLQELEQHNRQLQRALPPAESPESDTPPDSSGSPASTVRPDIARDSRQKNKRPFPLARPVPAP